MTDDALEPPLRWTERIAALEGRIALLEKALRLAFGPTWMEQLKGADEPASE